MCGGDIGGLTCLSLFVPPQCPHLIKLLMLESSPSESTGDIVTAMKPHPLHPMQYLVASGNRLMLMDVRMEAHSVSLRLRCEDF